MSTNDGRTILLQPTEDDPFGLLRKGPLGARPPSYIALFEPVNELTDGPYPDSVWRCPGCYAMVGTSYSREEATERIIHSWYCPYRSLPLVFEGKPVPEGIDRLARVTEWSPDGFCELWVQDVLDGHDVLAAVEGFGTIHIIDSDGRRI